jgi:hypothetical protein
MFADFTLELNGESAGPLVDEESYGNIPDKDIIFFDVPDPIQLTQGTDVWYATHIIQIDHTITGVGVPEEEEWNLKIYTDSDETLKMKILSTYFDLTEILDVCGFIMCNTRPQAVADINRDVHHDTEPVDGVYTLHTMTVHLDGSGSSDEVGDQLTYNWEFIIPEENPPTFSDDQAEKPTFDVDRVGEYSVKLVVYDGIVWSDPDIVNIVIINQFPNVNIGGPYNDIYESIPYTLDATITDADNDTLEYAWDLDGDGVYEDSAIEDPDYTWLNAGNYTISLKVNDGFEEEIEPLDLDIAVIDLIHIPALSSVNGQTLFSEGEEACFNIELSSNHPDHTSENPKIYLDELTFEWDWDYDDMSGFEKQETTYNIENKCYTFDPGIFNVAVKITDDDDNTRISNVVQIQVEETRPPVDIVFCLDGSGSMNNNNKFDQLKNATELFVKILKEMGGPERGPENRIGAVIFQWTCSLSNSFYIPSIPGIPDFGPWWAWRKRDGGHNGINPNLIKVYNQNNDELIPISELDNEEFIKFFNDHTPSYCTPLGEGLKRSIDILDGEREENIRRRRVIISLTDGLENEGYTRIDRIVKDNDADNDVYYEILQKSDDPLEQLEDKITVFSIGLGTDSDINESKIRDLGIYSGGNYINITDPEDLSDFFMQIFNDTLQKPAGKVLTPEITDSSEPIETIIEYTATKAVFILCFHEKPLTFFLERPNGTLITSSHCENVNELDGLYVDCVWGNKFACYIITDNDLYDNIHLSTEDNQLWRIFVDLGHPPQEEDRAIVLVDLLLRSKFYFDDNRHYIGDPIILTAEIRDGGMPVLNADVYVEIDRPYGPDSGIGNFLAMEVYSFGIGNLIPDIPVACMCCDSLSQPIWQLPGMQAMVDILLMQNKLEAIADYSDSTPMSFIGDEISDNGVDPERTQETIKLYDDGTHGDPIANDGNYNFIFRNTYAEGNYNFKFVAQGVAPHSRRFSRTKTISDFVSIKVDPEFSQFDVEVLDITDPGKAIFHVEMTITPQDSFRNLLGPFRADEITLDISDGKINQEIIDNFDGTYTIFLEFDRYKENPVVTPSILGEDLKPIDVKKAAGLVEPEPKKPCISFCRTTCWDYCYPIYSYWQSFMPYGSGSSTFLTLNFTPQIQSQQLPRYSFGMGYAPVQNNIGWSYNSGYGLAGTANVGYPYNNRWGSLNWSNIPESFYYINSINIPYNKIPLSSDYGFSSSPYSSFNAGSIGYPYNIRWSYPNQRH